MNWQYISGFFDADGYITIYRRSKNETETPVLGFTNTKLEILQAIKEFIDTELNIMGSISMKKASKENHSQGYDLKYHGFTKIELIKKFMVSIHPKKTSRLSLLVDIKRVTPRNGKYSEEVLSERNRLVRQFLEIK